MQEPSQTWKKFSSPSHVLRIMNDLQELYKESPYGLYAIPEENNICLIHALIIGPKGTPYENGFFYFVLKFPDNYPLKPPKVELKTTLGQTVRFNPSFFACGLVCLNILGTYSDSWSPVQTISTTLLSIQSLMTEHPYYNEPGFERSNSDHSVSKCAMNYNDYIQHETLRVAVVEMLRDNGCDSYEMPAALKEVMISHFQRHCEFYEILIRSNLSLEGAPVKDPSYGSVARPTHFHYKELLTEIVALKRKFGNAKDTSTHIYNKMTLSPYDMYDIANALEDVSEDEEDADVID